MSGLLPNQAKSTSFFCNVPLTTKLAIKQVIPFDEGELPIRYLGVPLIATKLTHSDCKLLMDKMEKRIMDWKTKFLSFAGRLQLINSVLAALYSYWAATFILPSSVIKSLERMMKRFLWNQSTSQTAKAKLSWTSVCRPKREGGLGIKRIKDMNKSLMASHIFSILSNRNSLWVQWIHSYRLKGRSFWDVNIPQMAPWSWRKILQNRQTFRPFLWMKLGNGNATFVWFDMWIDASPLKQYITPRQMALNGWSIKSKVSDMWNNGAWNWPNEIIPIASQLNQIQLHPHRTDSLLWKDAHGIFSPFSTHLAWESIRSRGTAVPWADLVWSSFSIPRHSFILWLIVHERLWTQDKLQVWNRRVNGSMNMYGCLLCMHDIDSHNHLFFECKYSRMVWSMISSKLSLTFHYEKWDNMVAVLSPSAKSKSVRSVVNRLLLAAVAYYVWQERNARFFKNQLRPPEVLGDIILKTVRLKLYSFKYKRTQLVMQRLKEWNIQEDDQLFMPN